MVADSEYFLTVNLIYTGLGLLIFGAIAVAGASTTGDVRVGGMARGHRGGCRVRPLDGGHMEH